MAKRKKLPFIICGAVVLLLGIIAIYGFVITKSGYWLLSQLRPDTPEQKLAFSSASDTVRKIAEEGIVLMQNDGGLLPLAGGGKVNLFGIRSVQLVYNGGGSAASDVSKCIKLEIALEGVGFTVNPDLLNLSYNFYKNGRLSIAATSAPPNGSASEFIDQPDNIILPELSAAAWSDSSIYSDGRTLLAHAREYSDTAIIVLGRGGGEGFDMEPSQLRLTSDERAMLNAVCGAFDKVAVILNTANVIECGFLREYPAIKSVVWIGYLGESGSESLARILKGEVNPSGRLSDTWVTSNLSAPAANNFKELLPSGDWKTTASFHYENAPPAAATQIMSGTNDQGFFMHYAEGIYVGYKYYETRAATEPSYNYDAEVVYPFGRGLSYTSFNKEIMAMNEEDGVITIRVSVQNTGSRTGKDVIEIYYNPPYTGAIEKASVNLVAFKKTNEIASGATEYYSLSFPLEDMASYDYKVNKSYMLEKGDYEIMLMADAHTQLDSETWSLSRDIIYNDAHDGKRPSDQSAAVNRLDDALGIDDYLTRSWNQRSRAFTGPMQADYTAPADVLDAIYWTAPTDAQLGLSGQVPSTGQDAGLKLADMVNVPYRDAKWDQFVAQLTIDEMSGLSANGAWQINGIDRLGVPRSLTPDGSTGIFATTYSGAVMGTNGVGVTYPTPVLIASSWSEDIALLMGTSVGNEGQAYGYSGWYAPSMNTHRTAFNGRNFEYYSEDGVLTGKIAAGVVRGAREKGMITFIKHFAMNERERDCRDTMFTWSNEQAIREIYLKPFELAIKEGGALGIMSAFNFIGHTWAGGNEALLSGIVRGEWGFEGVIITDAAIHPHMLPLQYLAAGGDLDLDVYAAWGIATTSTTLKNAAEDPATRIWVTRALQRASRDILYAVSRSWKM
jgi:beta-glucosidase